MRPTLWAVKSTYRIAKGVGNTDARELIISDHGPMQKPKGWQVELVCDFRSP